MLVMQFTGSIAPIRQVNRLLGSGAMMIGGRVIALRRFAEQIEMMHSVRRFIRRAGRALLNTRLAGVLWVLLLRPRALGSIRGAVWCRDLLQAAAAAR